MVSVSFSWPPYSYKENDHLTGLDIEILESLLKLNDLCWNYRRYPSSSRAFLEFQKGNVDLIFAASYSASRSEFAQFSLAYRQEIMMLFSQKNASEFESLKTPSLLQDFIFLENSMVAVNRGSVFGNAFESFRQRCKACVINTNQPYTRLKMLQLGRVDFAVEDFLTGLYLIRQRNMENTIAATNFIINDNDVFYMIRPGLMTPDELERFNQSILDSKSKINNLVQTYVLKYQ